MPLPLVPLLILLLAASPLRAAPTQEDVFKSIQDNVGEPTDLSLTRVLPFAAAAGGLVLLAAFVNQRRGRKPRQRAVNHQGRLMKEVLRTVPLRKAELRQLRLLTEDAPGDAPIASPLTLLLCPSLMAKSIVARQRRRAKIDRKTLSHLARKAGVTREMLTQPAAELEASEGGGPPSQHSPATLPVRSRAT